MESCLLFFDLDGTVLFHGIIDAGVRRALAEAQAAGHKIILNTGRSVAFVPSVVFELPWDGFICGSAFGEYHGTAFLCSCVSPEDLLYAMKFSIREGYTILLEGNHHLLTLKTGSFIETDRSVEEVAASVKDIVKLTIQQPINDEQAAELAERFEVIRLRTYTELLQKGFSKAGAMLTLADKLGVPRERVIAFGDSENDYSMLEAAGTAVIMKNAWSGLNGIADYRMTEDETGVAEFIQTVLLNKR